MFPYPSTISFNDGPKVLIGKVSLTATDAVSDGESVPIWNLEIDALGEIRTLPLASIEEVAEGEWEGQLWMGGPREGNKIYVRSTVPRDAETATLLVSTDSRYPMPVELLANLHSSPNGVLTMPELFALSDDDGFVGSLLLSAPTGLYVRYGFAWHYVSDPELIDGMNIIDVGGASVDLFDEFAKRGQSAVVSTYPRPKDGEVVGWASLGEPLQVDGEGGLVSDTGIESDPIVASSKPRTEVPTLSSIEDVPKAIQAALESPDIRWYVERRLGALGIETELPWA